MEFEWDIDKRLANFAKHNVDLVLAAGIFEGRIFTQEDGRNDYGEARFQSVGYIDDACIVVVWTERDGVIRLISARRGGRRDRRRYAQGVA